MGDSQKAHKGTSGDSDRFRAQGLQQQSTTIHGKYFDLQSWKDGAIRHSASSLFTRSVGGGPTRRRVSLPKVDAHCLWYFIRGYQSHRAIVYEAGTRTEGYCPASDTLGFCSKAGQDVAEAGPLCYVFVQQPGVI